MYLLIREPPFVVKKEDKYVFFMRHHLSQLVDIDVIADKNILVWEVKSLSHLLKHEIVRTTLYKEDPSFQQLVAESEEEYFVSYYYSQLPADAIIEETKRIDCDNESGSLVEVWVRRKKIVDLKSTLRAPRFKNFNFSVTTEVKLHQEEKEEILTTKKIIKNVEKAQISVALEDNYVRNKNTLKKMKFKEKEVEDLEYLGSDEYSDDDEGDNDEEFSLS